MPHLSLLGVSGGRHRAKAQGGHLDGDAAGDQVHVLLPGGGDAAAALGAVVLLHEADRLELLHDVADEAPARLLEVLGLDAAGLVAAAELDAQLADAEALADVDLAGDGRGADVVPVAVEGRQLLEARRLDDVDPVGDLELWGFGIWGRGGGEMRRRRRWCSA